MTEMLYSVFIVMLLAGIVIVKIGTIYQAVALLQLILIMFVLVGGLFNKRKR
jgi:hypothetical protein